MMFLLLFLAAPAQAVEFRWWGVGPTVGTMIFPVEYPIAFPVMIVDTGEIGGDPLVAPVKGDLQVGIRGVVYTVKSLRLWAHPLIGGNFSTWGMQELTLGFDGLFIKDGELQFMGGVGVGVGHERFSATDDFPQFDVSYFPIRGELAGLWRDRTRAYELSIYGTWHIAGESRRFDDADDAKGRDGSDFKTGNDLGLYVGLGVEASVYFGNFRNKDSGGGHKKKKH